MRFDVITIFPEAFQSYLASSIIGRAVKNRLIRVKLHNLRNWANDRRGTVDDKPYGGGPGMILKVEPIYKCLLQIANRKSLKTNRLAIRNKRFASRVILLSAKGKPFTQKDAKRFGKYRRLILISGHYEGVDERVKKHLVDEELSVGQYVLTGGELPAMVVIDACSRLIPGVVGKKESLQDESFSTENYLEYPQYTRPEIFFLGRKFLEIKNQKSKIKNGTRRIKSKSIQDRHKRLAIRQSWRVPKVLLSGDHKKIKQWREENSKLGRQPLNFQ